MQDAVVQFLTGRDASQEQTAAAHIAPADKRHGKLEPGTEGARKHVHVLATGHAAKKHRSAVGTERRR
jgi:hypothetical protein